MNKHQQWLFTFPVIVGLCIWLSPQVHCYDFVHFTMKNESSIRIQCDRNETLDSPTLLQASKDYNNETKTPTQLMVKHCPPPKRPYFEILKDININGSQVSTIWFLAMDHTFWPVESSFKGMPLKNVKIFASDYEFYVSVNSTEKIDLANALRYNIKCFRYKGDLFNRKAVQPRLLNVSHVKFGGCTTPNISYFDILQNLNVNPISVRELELQITPNSSNLKAVNFERLSLRKLNVSCMKFCQLDTELFKETTVDAVDEVYLRQVELRTLPSRIKKATLRNGRFVGKLDDCAMLTTLEMYNFTVSEIPGGWLSQCHNLTDLTLERVTQKDVDQILIGAHALTSLSVFDCNYNILTEPFAVNATNMRRLKFVDSLLSSISFEAFSQLKKLEELDISGNTLSGTQILRAITPLENLRKLTIDKNPLEMFCEDYSRYRGDSGSNHSGRINRNSELESVSIRHAQLSSICFEDWHNLTYLDLSDNRISELQLRGLPVPVEHPLTVDLRGNPLSKTSDEISELFKTTVEKYTGSQNITILLDFTVDCDCEHSWFVRALQKLPQVSLRNATCKSGEGLIDFHGERFNCYKYPCGDCICRTSSDDDTTTVDCNLKELHNFPRWSEIETSIHQNFPWSKTSNESMVKKILAFGNFIETISEFEYPKSWIEIDLSNNKITRISKSALDALFLDDNRRMRLAGNPLVCECDTQDMLDALSKYKDQVLDYANLTCSNQESFPDSSLCTERAILAFSIVGLSLLTLTAITAFIYIRYKLTIKAFLYARGLCLSYLREEELDADREYDAFLSFTHPDDELVNEVLLPALENDYRLCVHTRNWMPGELINTQIVKSVEQSRRTIVVLSKNFVESVWGMTEFHTAYSNALREGRVRVICIVIDDVIDDIKILDPELRSYLKSNTYLEFKDPFFWQKLRYAMPHRRVTSDESGILIQNEGNRCQEIELTSRGYNSLQGFVWPN